MNARQKLMAQILMGNQDQNPQQRIDGAFGQLPQGQNPQQRIDGAFGQLPQATPGQSAYPAPGMPQNNQADPSLPSWATKPTPQSAGFPQQNIPMPMARPASAPQPPQVAQPMNIIPDGAQTPQPNLNWFTKNAYLQRDPLTGEYLDPNLAAKAMG